MFRGPLVICKILITCQIFLLIEKANLKAAERCKASLPIEELALYWTAGDYPLGLESLWPT